MLRRRRRSRPQLGCGAWAQTVARLSRWSGAGGPAAFAETGAEQAANAALIAALVAADAAEDAEEDEEGSAEGDRSSVEDKGPSYGEGGEGEGTSVPPYIGYRHGPLHFEDELGIDVTDRVAENRVFARKDDAEGKVIVGPGGVRRRLRHVSIFNEATESGGGGWVYVDDEEGGGRVQR